MRLAYENKLRREANEVSNAAAAAAAGGAARGRKGRAARRFNTATFDNEDVEINRIKSARREL